MLAMIGRADDGGLGVQTWEIARHLHPERVLIPHVGDARGNFDPERYRDHCDELMVVANPPEPEHMRWLCTGADKVFTVEGWYQERVLGIARQEGAELCLLANPELYRAQYRELAERGLMRVFAPTEWERDRLGPHELLPMPVARDRCTFRPRGEVARTFLHVSAPAFHDRNGTEILRSALRVYTGEPITVCVSGPEAPLGRTEMGQHKQVSVVPVPHVTDYWSLYDDVDAMIMPRRYGGLSLVMQEALSCGLPVITLDREPERCWGGVWSVGTGSHRVESMKGGGFPVCEGDPVALCAAIELFARCIPPMFPGEADAHADAISWDRLLPWWEKALR